MKYFILAIILVFSFFSVLPLFHYGFFPIHDNTQVARVYEMTKALRDGMFPVRWSEDLGYGYGYSMFNFYNPLPYYAGGFIGLLGVNSLLATKTIMILGVIFSAFSMYLLAKEFWGKWGGVLSAMLYAYAPYHAVEVYVRGDVAEFWAYAFLPLIFYGLWKIYKEGKFRYVIVSSVAYACVITSHNLTALMSFPFVIAFLIVLLVKSRDKRRRLNILLAFFIGIALSAFYSFPAIAEMNYTNVISQVGGGADFKDHFVCFTQLWTSPWGFGGSAKGCVDGLSFMIGKYHIVLSFIVFILSLLTLFSKKFQKLFGEDKEKFWIIVISYLGFLISIFFTLSFSKPIWDLVKPMAFIQYPWRFLLMISFFSSFACGGIFIFLNKPIKNYFILVGVGLILSVGVVLLSLKFFVPQKYLPLSSSSFTNRYALLWNASKVSDEYMPKNFQKPKNFDELTDFSELNSQDLSLQVVNKKTQEINLKFEAKQDINKVLPLAYFPAWEALVDGRFVKLESSKAGSAISMPSGSHNLQLVFKETPIEMTGNLISIAGILALFVGIIYSRKKYE